MAVEGGEVIKRRLKLIIRNVQREVSVALDAAADDLLSRSRQLAPQLSGDLIDAGKVRGRGARDVQTRVIFYDSPYAVVRHEDFYNLGPISSLKQSPDGVIGRKYLETPFRRHNARYQKDLGFAINRAMRRSVR